MKIATIVGARPQFIKAAAVSREVNKYKNIEEIIVHTGQHYDHDMSEIFFQQLEIKKPDYNLHIGSSSHGEQTGQMLAAIESVLSKEKPDITLIYGDTNSTLAGALASAKLHIPVAHVEAGLRSYNRNMPEEINRVIADHSSNILFAPSQTAMLNLKNEGLIEKSIFVGDVMYDSSLHYTSSKYTASYKQLDCFNGEFVLVTIHRAENTDNKHRLCELFCSLEQLNKKIQVVMPLHPRTKMYLDRYEIKPKITFIEPQGYLEMLQLIKYANSVITDSGGVQKEAYYFNKPCLIARSETEWVELIDTGNHILFEPGKVNLYDAINNINISTDIKAHEKIYGSGDATEKIVKVLAGRDQ